MSYLLRGGLGIAPASCAAGTTMWCAKNADCSQTADYLLNPDCWQNSLTQWQTMAKLAAPDAVLTTAAPSAPAVGYTDTTGTSYSDVQAQATAGSNAGLTNEQAAVLGQSQSQAAITANSDTSGSGSSIPWWVWALVGFGGVVVLRRATA